MAQYSRSPALWLMEVPNLFSDFGFFFSIVWLLAVECGLQKIELMIICSHFSLLTFDDLKLKYNYIFLGVGPEKAVCIQSYLSRRKNKKN